MTPTTHLITREQFEPLLPILNVVRKRTRPRKHDLYDVLCAILYRRAHGTPWRDLPPVFPPWRTIHEYHTIWSMPPRDGGRPALERVLEQLGGQP